MEEAIKKIKEEMEKNKGEVCIVETGKYVLEQIKTNREAGKKIATGEKTIEGALEYLGMELYKRAKKGTTRGMIHHTEGFVIMNNYFEFKNIQSEMIVEEKVEEDHKENKVIKVDFDIELDDLL